MKYTEQAVETLDDAGGVIANKNIEIEQLRQRVAELEKERDEWEANSEEWEQEYYKVSKERDKATQYWQIAEGRCDALESKIDRLKYIMASNAYKDGATLSVEICVLDDEAVGDFSERIYLFVDRATEDLK